MANGRTLSAADSMDGHVISAKTARYGLLRGTGLGYLDNNFQTFAQITKFGGLQDPSEGPGFYYLDKSFKNLIQKVKVSSK